MSNFAMKSLIFSLTFLDRSVLIKKNFISYILLEKLVQQFKSKLFKKQFKKLRKMKKKQGEWRKIDKGHNIYLKVNVAQIINICYYKGGDYSR